MANAGIWRPRRERGPRKPACAAGARRRDQVWPWSALEAGAQCSPGPPASIATAVLGAECPLCKNGH
eukprot:3624546-Alexandrium_andersonii.AAC.1